jgi:hypothetical protein
MRSTWERKDISRSSNAERGHQSISSWQPTEETILQSFCWHGQCSNGNWINVFGRTVRRNSLSASLFQAVQNSFFNVSPKTREDSGYQQGIAGTRCSMCRLIRLLSTWCRAAAFFSASGAALSQEVPTVKMNVESAYALNTWYERG